MTYAIIEAGGHQLRIEVGRFYDIDYVPQSKPEAQLFWDGAYLWCTLVSLSRMLTPPIGLLSIVAM